MKKVMITLTFVLQFVETCLGIVGEIFVSLVEIKGIIVSKTFWIAVFYQPFIMFFVIILFLNKIDEFTKTWFEGGDISLSIIAYLIGLLLVALFLNALIELIFHFIYNNTVIETIYSIQDKALNYMMTIISLIAIYDEVNESSAKTMNTLLLGCGVIIFLCIIIADLYSFLFFSQGVVEKRYTRFVDRYEEKRNCICDLFSNNKNES